MINPFDPKRPTKGNCSYCQWPIEIYEDVHYSWVDKGHDLPVHKECVQEINEELLQKKE